jgi:hypothetical protein
MVAALGEGTGRPANTRRRAVGIAQASETNREPGLAK